MSEYGNEAMLDTMAQAGDDGFEPLGSAGVTVPDELVDAVALTPEYATEPSE